MPPLERVPEVGEEMEVRWASIEVQREDPGVEGEEERDDIPKGQYEARRGLE